MDKPNCTVGDCQRAAQTKGWCRKHYSRWRQHGDPTKTLAPNYTRKQTVTACAVEDCTEEAVARGWCNPHYQRWLSRGDPNAPRLARPAGSPAPECKMAACQKPVKARELCATHYLRLRVHGDPNVVLTPTPYVLGICSIADCGQPEKYRTWCITHYNRWRRHGDVEYVRPAASRPECSVDDCQEESAKRGKCDLHYHRQRRKALVECTVDGCTATGQTRGMCHRHYSRVRRYGSVDLPSRAVAPLAACSVEGCDKTVKSRGWCDTHLQRFYRTGSTEDPVISETRACRKCDRVLPRKEFSRSQPICRDCYPSWAREMYGPCKADGCDRLVRARGMCVTHLRRFYEWGSMELRERSITRVCTRCDRRLPRDQFARGAPTCLDCHPAYRQERIAKRLSRASGIRRSADELREQQGNCCAICRTPEEEASRGRLHLDHDHASRAVRGLLCGNCNTGLGHFKEDPVRMLAAIEYLRRTAAAQAT